ncbi:MAG TPA: hypothetical protein VFE32_19605 [Puia sp.]|jgi:hypothetical protein|nr:hypothetical protein [Puia sp.]
MPATVKTLLASLFILLTIPVRAQWYDFIVTLRHDTIYGNLKYRFSMPSTLETEQGSFPIDTKTVESYFSASRKTLARRRMLPGKKKYLFIPVLETGAITLFAFSTNAGVNGSTTTTFYAQKGDNALVEVWTNRGLFGNDNKIQRQAMADLISDNPTVRQTFDSDTKYDAIDAQYYIHEYNKGAASASP